MKSESTSTAPLYTKFFQAISRNWMAREEACNAVLVVSEQCAMSFGGGWFTSKYSAHDLALSETISGPSWAPTHSLQR